MKQIFPTILICGLLGGGLLIVTTLLPIKGWWSILTYAIVMFATMFVIKANKRIEINYLKTLVTGVLTFMIMSYVLYFYISIFENPNSGITLWGHTWRFLAMLGFALASSAILGLFFYETKS
ncbi:MAG TPA: hypothetical protein VI757_02120 [Bacteroidia bacterium]|nr:hypothetical protein [Bacteroidia bacterium]